MTEIVYNQFAPGGCFKQLSDAAGGSGISYSQYAAGGPVNQLRTHINPALVLDQHALGGVWGQAELVVEGGGDGAAPEWVPVDAKIHIDLVNDRAWTEADGEVAVDALLGSDPDTENAWGTSLYDPAKLTADGYVTDGNDAPALIGDALIQALDAATFVIKTKYISGFFGSTPFIAMSADGNDAVEFDLGSPNASASSYSGPLDISVNPSANRGPGAINYIAVTFTSGRFEFALNGGSVAAGLLTNDDRPVGNPFVAAMIDPNANNAIQSITFYDALSSTVGLSDLSETDITNTAPHDLEVLGVEGEYYQNMYTALGPDLTLLQVFATDDEGNQLVFSLTDPGGKLSIVTQPHATVGNVGTIKLEADFAAAGDYNFSVRATDSGGLYTDQAFTLTVGAPQ